MSANTEAQGSGRGLEAMKWVVVAVLLIVAIVGNYLYRDIMLPLRALAVVILIAAAGGVALLTTKGKATVAFAREARTEVRKVIWPTRQETLHTTLIVAAVTAVMLLILWGVGGISLFFTQLPGPQTRRKNSFPPLLFKKKKKNNNKKKTSNIKNKT